MIASDRRRDEGTCVSRPVGRIVRSAGLPDQPIGQVQIGTTTGPQAVPADLDRVVGG